MDPPQPRLEAVLDEVGAHRFRRRVGEGVASGPGIQHVARHSEDTGDLLCREAPLLRELTVIELRGDRHVFRVALEHEQTVGPCLGPELFLRSVPLIE